MENELSCGPTLRIRYANCWEDPLVMLDAIKPKRGGVYLSVASAGDNTLSLLTAGPELVVAVDSSPAQLACLEFRRAAFASLTHSEVLEVLGIKNGTDRLALYGRLRGDLSENARRFWDARPRAVRRGIIHAGTVERHFRMFHRWLKPILVRQARTPSGPVNFRTRPWRAFLKTIARPNIMAKLDLGRSRPWLAGRGLDIESAIGDRIKSAVSSPDRDSNPYLEYILEGNFIRTRPHYLQAENYVQIRRSLGRLVLFHGSARDALRAFRSLRFDGFNLSDIFETMDQALFEENLYAAARRASAGARVLFFENLVRHQYGGSLARRIVRQEQEASTLLSRNRAFFYGSLFVGEVVK